MLGVPSFNFVHMRGYESDTRGMRGMRGIRGMRGMRGIMGYRRV